MPYLQNILITGLLFFGAQACFAAENVYELTGVTITRSVSETRKTGQGNLREAAMQDVLQTGYRQFLQRVTPQSVWPRHTWLMAELPPKKAIVRVSITREETFPAYELEATLTFNREALRALFTSQGIPFHESAPATVLIIPVYEVGQARMLWEEQNPWRLALQQTLLSQGGLSFVLPAGELQEMLKLTPNMAVAGATDVLQEFAQSYHADAVVVSRLQVKSYGARTQLEVDNTWLDASVTADNNVIRHIPNTLELGVGEQVTPPLLADAALQTYSTLERAWQQERTVQSSSLSTVFIKLNAKTPQEAHALEALLQGFSSVQSVLPRLIRKGEVRYQVEYFGKINPLAEDLRAAGYVLERMTGGWHVIPKAVN